MSRAARDGRPAYVVVTPAHNEAGYIVETLVSVAAQRVPPLKWVVVNDGSTDATEALVAAHGRGLPYLELVRSRAGGDACFGAKVRAIHQGYERLRGLDFDYFANLDADITLPSDYYALLLERFEANPRLGVAGGLVVDAARRPGERIYFSRDDVACAVQMFRRRCFEEIGGYLPLAAGGEDTAAGVMARMRGWEVRTFEDLPVLHRRPVACKGLSPLRWRYRHGKQDYLLGYHPFYHLFKCANRLVERPRVIGSLGRLAGFHLTQLRREPRAVDAAFVAFLRRGQRARMRQALQEIFRGGRTDRRRAPAAEGGLG